MARINLLPWREKLRKQRQIEFFIMLTLMVVITALVMLGVHMYEADRIDYQKKRIAFIKNSIRQLDKKIAEIKRIEKTRETLRRRIEKVRDLERNRAEVVHLVDEVSRRLPKDVYLTAIIQQGRKVVLKGVAEDNNNISHYITQLEKSDWLGKLVLDIVKRGGSRRGRRNGVIEFTLNAEQKQVKEGEEHKKVQRKHPHRRLRTEVSAK